MDKKEGPSNISIRALLRFNRLGPDVAYRELKQDPLYDQTRQRHSEENKALAEELKPVFQHPTEIQNLLGIKDTQPLSTKMAPDSSEGKRMSRFIRERLVDPDITNYLDILLQEKLIPSNSEEASPLVMQMVSKRYFVLMADWTEKLIEHLAR